MEKILSIRNDFMFQRVLGSEGNKDILIDLLNAFLRKEGEETIIDVSILKTVVDYKLVVHKRSILDVYCTCKNGVHFIVEMQVDKDLEFIKRAQYYASKTYTNQLKKGEGYETLKEVVFLAFLNHELFPKKIDWISNHEILDTETGERDLKDFSYTFVEIPKFEKTVQEVRTEDELWTLFFKRGESLSEKEAEMFKKNPIFNKAIGLMVESSLSEDERRDYEAAEKAALDTDSVMKQNRKEGREEGIVIGEERGKLEKALEMARKMKEIGLPTEQIVLVSGLSQEEIDTLG
jgi:predicted transposase/invertase (TIGR01784 family)